MKKDTHPEYNFVVLEDSSANYRFLTRSTMKPDATKTTVWEDGETYPVVQLEISNASHPFFTACQYHPEFLSRPGKPHPLFRGLIEAAQQRAGAS